MAIKACRPCQLRPRAYLLLAPHICATKSGCPRPGPVPPFHGGDAVRLGKPPARRGGWRTGASVAAKPGRAARQRLARNVCGDAAAFALVYCPPQCDPGIAWGMVAKAVPVPAGKASAQSARPGRGGAVAAPTSAAPTSAAPKSAAATRCQGAGLAWHAGFLACSCACDSTVRSSRRGGSQGGRACMHVVGSGNPAAARSVGVTRRICPSRLHIAFVHRQTPCRRRAAAGRARPEQRSAPSGRPGRAPWWLPPMMRTSRLANNMGMSRRRPAGGRCLGSAPPCWQRPRSPAKQPGPPRTWPWRPPPLRCVWVGF